MPDLTLPSKMSALRSHLDDVVAIVEARAPYGAVLLSDQSGLQIQVDNREERVTELPRTAGTVITAFDGATLRETAIAGFERSTVEQGARDLVRDATFTDRRSIDPGPERRGDFTTPHNTLSARAKLDRCRDLQQRLTGLDPRIVNVRIDYREITERSAFRNRAADLAQHVERMHLFVIVIVAGPDGTRYDAVLKSAVGNWDALVPTDDELQAVVDHALALLSAERIEPGEYTIITSPGVSGTICHESFGHGVETDMFLKERARAVQYLDRVVASPLVNIYDDPSRAGGFGFYFFDDEGQLAAPTQIVENGLFRRGITDLYSATALNLRRSANGRRQDYTRKAYARMTNTFFAPGATPVEEMFAQVDHGIYLERWLSGMEDPQGWGIQVTCHYGHEIKHGKVTQRMFAPIGITGYVPDVLQTITAVGNDLVLEPGLCGKGHKETVVTSAGGPHLLLKARLG